MNRINIKKAIIVPALAYFILAGAGVFAAGELLTDWERDVQELFKGALPSIVKVVAEQKPVMHKVGQVQYQYLMPTRVSVGTGAVYDDEGHIVTSAGIVGDSEKVKVIDTSGNEYEAVVVGADDFSDIAVIKAVNLSAPEIACEMLEGIDPGSVALLIGYSVTESPNFSFGFINVLSSSEEDLKNAKLTFGGPLLPGNAGAPLIDVDGRLIGMLKGQIKSDMINWVQKPDWSKEFLKDKEGLKKYKDERAVWVPDSDEMLNYYYFTPSEKQKPKLIQNITRVADASKGLGLATPVNMIINVSEKLIKYGQVRRGWLGVTIQHTMQPVEGALVISVIEDSPAEKAGIQEQDVIMEIEGEAIKDVIALVKMVQSHESGDEISVKLYRDEEEIELNAVLEVKRDQPAPYYKQMMEEKMPQMKKKSKPKLGVIVQDVIDEESGEAEAQKIDGTTIIKVIEGSPAEKAGLKENDVIIAIDDHDIDSSGALLRTLGLYEGDEEIEIAVIRGDKEVSFHAKLEAGFKYEMKPGDIDFEQKETLVVPQSGLEGLEFWKWQQDSSEKQYQMQIEKLNQELEKLKDKLQRLHEERDYEKSLDEMKKELQQMKEMQKKFDELLKERNSNADSQT